MSPTDKVLGDIAAIQTFIDNFPMSILDMLHGKQYSSIFEFLIDVLNACGVNTNEIIEYLLDQIYGIQATIDGGIEDFFEKIKNGTISIDEQSNFLSAVESGIKGVLMALLSSIFTCSAIPVIPFKMFDYDDLGGLINTQDLKAYLEGGAPGLVIPTSIIDPMNLLSISPMSKDGQLYYAVEGGDKFYRKELIERTDNGKYEYGYIECAREDANGLAVRKDFVPENGVGEDDAEYIVCYAGLNPNTLYKTNDMNSFIWYATRKGMSEPIEEYNHMMWDSRIPSAKEGNVRESSKEWNEWYSSKSDWGKEFDTEKGIYPIIQLERHNKDATLLKIHLPAQRYLLPKRREILINGGTPKGHFLNASIYKFNWEYLNSIQILHPKLLLVGLCESLLGYSFSTINSININGTKTVIQAKLSKAIKNIIEANDMEVEDCYMSFSNDDVNDMLEEMLLSRYQATPYGGEETVVKTHNIEKYMSQIDSMNQSAKQEGQVAIAKKLVSEITASPGTEPVVDYGLELSIDDNLLTKLIWALVMPIIQSIFSPQVMLLIVMNFELMGITKIEDFMGYDMSKILNLLMNKILGLTRSLVLLIKDEIVRLLFKLLFDKILPLLEKWGLLIILERLEHWLTILKAALNCLPLYKFKRTKIISAIDEVDYADIETPQNIPEIDAKC